MYFFWEFVFEESTFETGKRVSYFTLKIYLIFQIFKFRNFQNLHFMTSSKQQKKQGIHFIE